MYGRRAPWEDPTDWIIESYPWPTLKDEDPALLRLRPEDVGYDSQGVITTGVGSPQPQSKSPTSTKNESDTADPLVSDV